MLLGIVFVIDCNDRQRIQLARKELLNLSTKLPRSSSIPIVIAANKQDVPRAFRFVFIIIFFKDCIFLEALRKEDLIRELSLSRTQSNEWRIFELSAHTGKNF